MSNEEFIERKIIKRVNIPEKASGIYQISAKINNKIYIGSTVNLKSRKKQHFNDLKLENHHNIYLQRYTNKYGMAALQFSILEFCPKEKLIKREQFYIDILKPEFNICKIAASCLGVKRSKDVRNKMSISHKGKFTGKDNPFFGKHHSAKTKKKISRACIGIGKGEEHPFYGKHHSAESRKRISKNHANFSGQNNPNFGKQYSIEIKEKMSINHADFNGENNPMFGSRISEEHKRKMKKGLERWKRKREVHNG